LIAQNKSRKERNLVSNPNTGKFYKFINSKLKHKQQVLSLRLPNGDVTTDERVMCEIFNEYFQSVFANETEIYPEHNVTHGPAIDDMIITRADVEAAILNCSNKCSAGRDGIPNIFL
jgi:hypothetical protein